MPLYDQDPSEQMADSDSGTNNPQQSYNNFPVPSFSGRICRKNKADHAHDQPEHLYYYVAHVI